jgi:hypothetical protein
MKIDPRGLFTELEPPPGGAERFRQRLEETARAPATARPRVFAFATAAAGAAVALMAALFLLRDPSDSPSPPSDDSARTADAADTDSPRTAGIYAAPEFDRLLGRPPQPAGLSVKLNEQTASVVEIETANEKVRIYRIN